MRPSVLVAVASDCNCRAGNHGADGDWLAHRLLPLSKRSHPDLRHWVHAEGRHGLPRGLDVHRPQ
jgi:hypothetical protein